MWKLLHALWLGMPALALLALAGCSGARTDGQRAADPAPAATDARAGGEEEEAEVRAALAKLSPEDRQIAEAQRFCAVLNDNRLGSMGAPVKVVVKDQPVFLCCKGCRKQALADPERTLARVQELREKAARPSP